MNLIRIQKDNERAKSLVTLAAMRYKKIGLYDQETESTLILEMYYEIAKELITAILFTDGYKTLSHIDLIEYLRTNYKNDFDDYEIELIDQLRKYRNKIVYYGIFIEASYLKMNNNTIRAVIDKLFKLCDIKTKPSK